MSFPDILVLFLPATILCLFILIICFNIYRFNGPFGDGASYLFLSDFLRNSSIGKFDPRAAIGDHPVGEGGIYFSITNFLYTRNFLYKYPYMPNILIFYALLVISTSISYPAFTDNIHIDNRHLQNLQFLICSFLSILLIPLFWISNQTIHFYNYQPRALGLFLGNILFTIIVSHAYWSNNNLTGVIAILLYACLAFCTYFFVDVSVFSRQVYVLVLIPSAFITSNIYIICSLILPVCSKFFAQDFRDRIKVQINYHKQYSSYGIKALMAYKPLSFRITFIQNILNLLKKSISASSKDLLLWLPVYITSLISFYFFSGDFLSRTFFIFLIPFIVALITTLRRFSFIGEGWRYIAFTSIPVLVFGTSLYLMSVNLLLKLAILVLIASFYQKRSSFPIENDNFELLHLFKDMSNLRSTSISLYCVPYRLGTPLVNAGIASKTTEFQAGHAEVDLYKKYFASFPSIPNLNPAWVFSDSFNYLLVSRQYFEQWLVLNEEQIVKRDFCYKIINESENYLLATFSII